MSEQTMKTISKPTLISYVICILASLFYLYEFALQVSPSVMANELMRDFSIGAAGFGSLSGFYYFAYAPMQVPAGLLYDRFGPKKIIFIAILCCAMGAFCFSLTHTYTMALVGRFMMGFGSAFSFIGVLVLISEWFPPAYFAVLAGVAQLMSSVGAICGQVPLAHAVNTFGWRHTILALAITGAVLAVLIFLTVHDSPEAHANREVYKREKPKLNEFAKLNIILKNPQTWYNGFYSFFIWAPILTFTASWGVKYIMLRYGVSNVQASTVNMMAWIGIGLGAPLIGWWSDKIGLRRKPLIIASFIGLIACLAMIYIPNVPYAFQYVLSFFFGLSAAGQTLIFAPVKENNRPDVVGTAIGFNNMMVVLGGLVFQPLIGVLLHLFWLGDMVGGVPHYHLHAYDYAFLTLPIDFIVCLVISIFYIRETYCIPIQHD